MAERDGIKIEKKKERRKEREEAKVQKLTHDGERINYTLYPRVIVARELCLAATTNRDSNYCQLRPRHGTDDLQRGAFRKFTHGLLQFHFFTLSFSSPPPFFSNNKVSLERITSLARSRRINLINSFRIARSSFLYRRRSLSTEPFRTSQISLRPGPNNINHTERWRIRLGSARNLYPIQTVRTCIQIYIHIYIHT